MTEIEKEYYRRLALQEEYGGTNKPVNKIIPLVSVVTITYQHAPYIRQCLDGILMQETDFPYELIIGEDGSTDGTREICIEYANSHPDKIRLFLRDRKLTQYVGEQGQTIRFNGSFSQAAARGKYIALCEGDDYWIHESKLANQFNLLESNNDISLCFHNAKVLNEIKPNDNRVYNRVRNCRYYRCEEIVIQWTIPTASVMFKNLGDKIIMVNLNPSFIFGDLPLWISLSKYGKLFGSKEYDCVYRRHSDGLLYQAKKTHTLNEFLQYYNALSQVFPNCKYVFEYIKLKISIISIIKGKRIDFNAIKSVNSYKATHIHRYIIMFVKDIIYHISRK